MRRRPWAVSVALSVLLAPAVAAAAPVHAAPGGQYVALGDSFTSGVGTREYYDESCSRSDHAYPRLDAERLGLELSFDACSGATVQDVLNDQLHNLNRRTDFVTLMVGGNDAGYADVITACAMPWWASDCDRAIDRAEAFIRNRLPGLLDGLYDEVRSRAPYARVIIVGYPHLFMGEDCNAATFFSPREMNRLNAAGDLLNETTAARARADGFDYVNPVDAFTGHAVCDDVEWINGLSRPVTESYHPNRGGHVGYADLVDDHLG
ncbi:MAG: SGNH/GDSL hydrolase family protein [Propionibacteriales bacterium]|nr:SGNH/GDSL hydrolase family protein [Propionibacteriales bacterium]